MFSNLAQISHFQATKAALEYFSEKNQWQIETTNSIKSFSVRILAMITLIEKEFYNTHLLDDFRSPKGGLTDDGHCALLMSIDGWNCLEELCRQYMSSLGMDLFPHNASYLFHKPKQIVEVDIKWSSFDGAGYNTKVPRAITYLINNNLTKTDESMLTNAEICQVMVDKGYTLFESYMALLNDIWAMFPKHSASQAVDAFSKKGLWSDGSKVMSILKQYLDYLYCHRDMTFNNKFYSMAEFINFGHYTVNWKDQNSLCIDIDDKLALYDNDVFKIKMKWSVKI